MGGQRAWPGTHLIGGVLRAGGGGAQARWFMWERERGVGGDGADVGWVGGLYQVRLGYFRQGLDNLGSLIFFVTFS